MIDIDGFTKTNIKTLLEKSDVTRSIYSLDLKLADDQIKKLDFDATIKILEQKILKELNTKQKDTKAHNVEEQKPKYCRFFGNGTTLNTGEKLLKINTNDSHK